MFKNHMKLSSIHIQLNAWMSACFMELAMFLDISCIILALKSIKNTRSGKGTCDLPPVLIMLKHVRPSCLIKSYNKYKYPDHFEGD